MRRLAALLVFASVLVGCGETGPAPLAWEPPKKPFVGTIHGKLLIFLEGGRSIRDSFVVTMPNTTTAKFAILRRGRVIEIPTVRDSVLPAWNDTGDPTPATPGVAWRSTWAISEPPVSLGMWGYYTGGGDDVTFIGRLRYAIPHPEDPEIQVKYSGIWDATVTRNKYDVARVSNVEWMSSPE